MNQLDNMFELEPLCDELQACLESDPVLGQVLRHKLVLMPLYAPPMAKLANHALKQKRQMLADCVQKENWSQYIFLHERPFRLEALLEILPQVQKSKLGELIAETWIDSEGPSVNIAIWKMLFHKADKESLMTPEELEVFNALPDKVKIYRGAKAAKDSGISWTLNKKTAQWFANRFGQGGKVITKTVSKEKIIAYFTRRGEEEIIFIAR